MTDYSTIRLDVTDGGIATLAFDRPDHFNGLTVQMADEMADALAHIAADPQVRVVVLTGIGRSFCPGADVIGFNAEGGPEPAGSASQASLSLPVQLYEMPVPTIAAINGACAGAGLGFACACDLRVAVRDAVFRSAFLNVGLAGDMGVPWLLPRLIGEAAAKTISFLDEKFSADQASQYGLVHSVYDPPEFADAVHALAERMAALPTAATRALKRHYLTAPLVDYRTYVDLEFQRHFHLLKTDDAREGFRSFSEKSTPRFAGNQGPARPSTD